MAVGVVYLVGLLVTVVFGSFDWVRGRDVPGPWWWNLTVGAFLTGVAWILLEGVGAFLGKGFTFRDDASPARKRLGVCVVIFLFAALVIGLPLYHISQQ